jgi:hypothetical protein
MAKIMPTKKPRKAPAQKTFTVYLLSLASGSALSQQAKARSAQKAPAPRK